MLAMPLIHRLAASTIPTLKQPDAAGQRLRVAPDVLAWRVSCRTRGFRLEEVAKTAQAPAEKPS